MIMPGMLIRLLLRINRYIVGCKCFVLRNAFQKLVELIDT